MMMTEEIVVVRNLETGLEHTVQAGHWAVEDDGYEIVEAPKKATRKRKRAATKSTKDSASEDAEVEDDG